MNLEFLMLSRKKTSRLIGALFFLLLAIGVWLFYSTNYDKLPPKSPLKIARYTSGLDIPDEVEIVFFERNDQTFGGDFSDQIVIQLSEVQTKDIQQEWEERGYEKESLARALSFASGGSGVIAENTHPSDEGLYRRIDRTSYEATIILNTTSKQLIISDSSD